MAPPVLLRRIAVLVVLVGQGACDFSASSKVQLDTAAGEGAAGDGGDGTAGDGETAEDGGGDGGDSGAAPLDEDGDGDGYAPEDGDCDDADPSIHPDRTDVCDGIDEDCDGEIDEDAVDSDPTEGERPHSLGFLEDGEDALVEAILFDNDDIDTFVFSMDDSGWGLFSVSVGLSGVPTDATYVLRLWDPEGTLRGEDAGGGALGVSTDDTAFVDEEGTWTVEVSAEHGAACDRPYLLAVAVDG